jgi:hypothetical protein
LLTRAGKEYQSQERPKRHLESRVATEQKAIFRLIHDSEQDKKTDIVEALEKRLSDLHVTNYWPGGEIEKSAARILGHIEQQVKVAIKTE